MKRIKLRIFQWRAAAVLLLGTQSQALAHAFLDHADPKVGNAVDSAPSEIKLWFTQDVEPAFSSIEVRNAAGSEVDKKDVHLDAKNKSLLIVSVPQLPSGTYTVFWRVVSVDTHKTQGHFEFTIKATQK
ncbi:MAG TPA: copper resistance CopC family protein [Verrucomicrobiae bacterium]|nr:copper resistance CopC family protein [Verrucomicrobiae bacterium]